MPANRKEYAKEWWTTKLASMSPEELSAFRERKRLYNLATRHKYAEKARERAIKNGPAWRAARKEKLATNSILAEQAAQRRNLTRKLNYPKERAAKENRKKCFPSWLTAEQKEAIKSAYVYSESLTRETGVPHQVDHIYPLLGRSVCGLHVPWNLQVIPASENGRKNNKLPEDFYGETPQEITKRACNFMA